MRAGLCQSSTQPAGRRLLWKGPGTWWLWMQCIKIEQIPADSCQEGAVLIGRGNWNVQTVAGVMRLESAAITTIIASPVPNRGKPSIFHTAYPQPNTHSEFVTMTTRLVDSETPTHWPEGLVYPATLLRCMGKSVDGSRDWLAPEPHPRESEQRNAAWRKKQVTQRQGCEWKGKKTRHSFSFFPLSLVYVFSHPCRTADAQVFAHLDWCVIIQPLPLIGAIGWFLIKRKTLDSV